MSSKPTDYELARALWYQKLKDETDFIDIEQDEHRLKVWSAKHAHLYDHPSVWEANASYYHMATKFLNEFNFEKNLDKIIWEYHSEGIGLRDIAKLLDQTKVKKMSHETAAKTVRRLEHIMKTMYLHGYKEDNE